MGRNVGQPCKLIFTYSEKLTGLVKIRATHEESLSLQNKLPILRTPLYWVELTQLHWLYYINELIWLLCLHDCSKIKFIVSSSAVCLVYKL